MKTENELEIETIKDKIYKLKNMIIFLEGISKELLHIRVRCDDITIPENLTIPGFSTLSDNIHDCIKLIHDKRIDPLRIKLSKREGN